MARGHAPAPPLAPQPLPPAPLEPPASITRLEMDIVAAAAGIAISLLVVQILHWRPSPYLTHGGASMLLGMGLNALLWTITSAAGNAQVISIVVSPAAHDWVYFGLLPPISMSEELKPLVYCVLFLTRFTCRRLSCDSL